MFDFGIDFSFKDQKSPTFVLHLEKKEKMPVRKAFGHPRIRMAVMLPIVTSPLCDCLSKLWRRLQWKPASTTSQLQDFGQVVPSESPFLYL